MSLTFSWLSPYFNAPIYATSNGASETIASYAVAILQVGSFLGRALSGVLADRFGVWNMYTLSGLTSAISLFAFWIASPLPDAVIVLGLIIYGFGSGAWITLVAASCGAISPVREFGMRLGMLWSLSSIGILAGPVICGGESINHECAGQTGLMTVLINADDQKFGYAAIFCAMTTLIGVMVAVAPVGMRWLAERVLAKRDQGAALAEKGQRRLDAEDTREDLAAR